MELAGKAALITGGTSGIGLSSARELIRKKARVIVSGRTPPPETLALLEAEAASVGTEVLFLQADVSRKEDCKRLVQESLDRCPEDVRQSWLQDSDDAWRGTLSNS